jgi:hypothetical protein
MVVVKNPDNYKFMRFEKSHLKNKKYNAILKNTKYTNKYKTVPFGDPKYSQYKDRTGLGLYSHKDHNDKLRRLKYRLRHGNNIKNKFSSAYFSYFFLW